MLCVSLTVQDRVRQHKGNHIDPHITSPPLQSQLQSLSSYIVPALFTLVLHVHAALFAHMDTVYSKYTHLNTCSKMSIL